MNLAAPTIDEDTFKEEGAHRHARGILRYITVIIALFGVAFGAASPFLAFVTYRSLLHTRGRVLGESVRAYEDLTAASSAFHASDIGGALKNVSEAHEHFAVIEGELKRYGPLARLALLFNGKARSYYHLAQTGLHSTKAATILGRSGDARGTEGLIPYLLRLHGAVEEAREPIESAYRESQDIDLSYFTDSERAQIEELRQGLSFIVSEFDPFLETLSAVRRILGEGGTRRYLLLFQNSGELRPTAGFIGSLAIIDILDGRLNTFFVPSGGTYDLRYGLTEHRRSPRPFSILNPEWQPQDCNWFPDFLTSAKKCAWFVEGAIGSSFDGVVALTDGVVVDLLRILGPIPLPEYETVITSENFVPFTQTVVESDEARASGSPKAVIADLFPIIADRLMDADWGDRLSLARALLDALARKDLLLYMEDDGLQAWLEKENWGGVIGGDDVLDDYLHVNAALVNGGKSEFAVQQTVQYDVFEDSSGPIIASVAITREHKRSASGNSEFDALVNLDNVSYIRVYAPENSVFLGIEGDVFDPDGLFQDQTAFTDDAFLREVEGSPLIDEATKTRITHEFGKTAFGNYLKVAPGEKKTITFIYKLPFTRRDIEERGYTLFVQKQGGIVSRLIVKVFGKIIYDGALEKDSMIK